MRALALAGAAPARPLPGSSPWQEVLGDADDRPAAPRGDRRGKALRRLLAVADLLALSLAFVVVESSVGEFRLIDLGLLALSVPLWFLAAYGHRLYHLDSHRADHRAADELVPVLHMTTLWSWSAVLLLSLIRPNEWAVAKLALFWCLTVVLLIAFRSLVRAFARRRPWYLQHAVVVGPQVQARAIMRKIERHPEWGIRPVAGVDLPEPRRFSSESDLRGTGPPLQDDSDLVPLVCGLDVDRVILTPGMIERRADVLCELTQLGVHVDLIPSWQEVVGGRLELHEMEGMPLLTVPRARLSRTSLHLKRALDVVAATLSTAVLAPLLVACANAIKLDSPGPILFRQLRVGRHNRPFERLVRVSRGLRPSPSAPGVANEIQPRMSNQSQDQVGQMFLRRLTKPPAKPRGRATAGHVTACNTRGAGQPSVCRPRKSCRATLRLRKSNAASSELTVESVRGAARLR